MKNQKSNQNPSTKCPTKHYQSYQVICQGVHLYTKKKTTTETAVTDKPHQPDSWIHTTCQGTREQTHTNTQTNTHTTNKLRNSNMIERAGTRMVLHWMLPMFCECFSFNYHCKIVFSRHKRCISLRGRMRG